MIELNRNHSPRFCLISCMFQSLSLTLSLSLSDLSLSNRHSPHTGAMYVRVISKGFTASSREWPEPSSGNVVARIVIPVALLCVGIMVALL